MIGGNHQDQTSDLIVKHPLFVTSDSSLKKISLVFHIKKNHKQNWKRRIFWFSFSSYRTIFHLNNVLRIAWGHCNTDTKCLRHLSDTGVDLFQQLHSVVHYEVCKTVLHLHLERYHHNYDISEATYTLCVACRALSPLFVVVGWSFGGTVPKLELLQKKNTQRPFFHTYNSGRLCFKNVYWDK